MSPACCSGVKFAANPAELFHVKLCRTVSPARTAGVHALGGWQPRTSRILAISAGILVALVAVLGSSSPAMAKDTAAKTSTTTASTKKAPSAKETFRKDAYENEKLSLSDDATTAAKAKSSSPSSGGAVLRMIFGLLVVVGLIFGVHKLLKRATGARLGGVNGAAGVIEVVATTPLAQGRQLHLVRVGREMVLVGATDTSITQIAKVDGRGMLDDAGQRGDSEFQSQLHASLNGPQGGGGNGGEPRAFAMNAQGGVAAPSFWSRFVNNLQLMTSRT